MMGSKNTRIAVTVIILVLGIFVYIYQQKKLAENTKINVVGGKLLKFSGYNVIAQLNLEIENKTNIPLKVFNQHYTVFVNDVEVTKLKDQGVTTIEAKTSSPAVINLEFDPLKVLDVTLSNVAALFSDKANFVLKIVGKLDLRSGLLVTKNHTFTKTMTLKELLSTN